jgi:hypothetical protein
MKYLAKLGTRQSCLDGTEDLVTQTTAGYCCSMLDPLEVAPVIGGLYTALQICDYCCFPVFDSSMAVTLLELLATATGARIVSPRSSVGLL